MQALVSKIYRGVVGDRKPPSNPLSRQRALYAVTNIQLKIYFKLSTLQLCKPLIDIIERPGGVCESPELFAMVFFAKFIFLYFLQTT